MNQISRRYTGTTKISLYVPLVLVPQLIMLLNAPETKEKLAKMGARNFAYEIVPEENTTYRNHWLMERLAHWATDRRKSSLFCGLGQAHRMYFHRGLSHTTRHEQYDDFPLSILDNYEDFNREVITRISTHLTAPFRN